MFAQPTSSSLKRRVVAAIAAGFCGTAAFAQGMPLTLALNDAVPQAGGTAAGAATGATPDAPPPAPSGDELSIVIAPYLWAPSVSANVNVGSRSAHLSASFTDLVQDSDSLLGFMCAGEVNYGRWIAFINGIWMDLGFKKQTSNVGVVNAALEIGIIEFGAGYRILELPEHGTGGGVRFALDGFVGGRYTAVETSLYQATVFSKSKTNSFCSPVLGGRFTIDFGKDWRVITSGSVGGFDVGSQFEWSALVALEWRFQLGSVDSGLILGYRALGYQLQNGPRSLAQTDIALYGPVFGMEFRF